MSNIPVVPKDRQKVTHARPPAARFRRLVRRFGWCITVRLPDGRSWQVPRHWIALHWLTAPTLPGLAAVYGWEDVSDPSQDGQPR
jgi:hypothetical protein